MILRTGVIALLITLCLAGCSATEPMVWKADNVSFAGFQAFEIQRVFNASGKKIDPGILSFFTAHLKEQFKVQNLQLIDTRQTKNGVLLVQNDILVYETNKLVNVKTLGSGIAARKAQCRFHTRLVEKSTGNIVAKISTVTEMSIGSAIGGKPQEMILKEAAVVIVKEVARLMQPIETEKNVWQQI